MNLQQSSHSMGYPFSLEQAVGVSIVQADGAAGQLGKAENVSQQVLGKDGAAGADEGYSGHSTILS